MRSVLAIVLFGACLPSGPGLAQPDDAGAPPPTDLNGDGAARSDVDLGDPYALVGLQPSHGPFSGGTRTVLAGRGFPSTLRVFVAGTEVPQSDIFASDPTRAAITTPPGPPGTVDVTILNDLTQQSRTLQGAFTYDAFDVTPPSGATSGGTRIALHGSGTTWATGTTVTIDAKPCANVAVADATHLECTTPANTAGSKDVTVINADTSQIQVTGGFTYSDSVDGFRGGLSGGALSGSLKVIALDSYTGNAIPGAYAILGSDASTALVQKTDTSGVALVTDSSLTGTVTVTVGGKCHQPISFVDVPVDTVTAYLNPVFDPSCGQGDIPQTGGTGRDVGASVGELIWPTGSEFQSKGDWVGVPQPVTSGEYRAAYAFVASSSPDSTFYLPDPSLATTMQSDGTYGYQYSVAWYPGNVTIYALAGIENDSTKPRTFIPYMMGVQRGVPIAPKVATTHVDIKMQTLLDHALSLSAKPPAPNGKGPDRLISRVAVSLGQNAFGIFPISPKTEPLPYSGLVSFIGLPAMAGALMGESYVVSASAVTGPSSQVPLSIVSQVRTNDANVPLSLTGYLPVPVLVSPSFGAWDGTHVTVTATGTIDLVEVVVSSAGGLVSWTIVSPGNKSFALPDLQAISSEIALRHGAIQTTAQIAHIDAFSYSKLRYGQLYSSAWNAYAADALSGVY